MGLCPSTAFRPSSSTGASSTSSPNPVAQFSVVNVDEYGNDGSKGTMEVFPEGILLRRRHTTNVYWPLRSLRRYGCNDELFTFESGRQCETGPGVFAFRLKRPEKLFATVKHMIESEAQALLDGTRRAQAPVSASSVGVILVPPNEAMDSPGRSYPSTTPSSPSSPPSLLLCRQMPTTILTEGASEHHLPTHPTHHEFIEPPVAASPYSHNTTATGPTDRPSKMSRASRPPPINLTSMYSQPQPKTQLHAARWDYVDLAEPPTTARSPQSLNGKANIMPTRSVNADSTHYTQVDINRTDAMRNATSYAPSSANPGSSSYVFPAINGNGISRTSSASLTSPAVAAATSRAAMPSVSMKNKGSDS